MGRHCQICSHPKLADIDRKIAVGVPLRSISSEFGLSNGGLGRHKVGCCGIVTRVRSKVPKPPEEKKTKFERTEPSRAMVALHRLPDREELGEMLLGLHSRLDAIADRCETEGASALSISAIDKMRLQLQDMARLQGYSGGTDRSINVNVGVSIAPTDIAAAFMKELRGAELDTKTIEALLDD